MKKNVVFLINIVSNEHSKNQRYDLAVKSWKDWADKNNHETLVLTEQIADLDYMRPNWYKLYAFDLLDSMDIEYDQILYADSDTIVHPNMPNVFEMSENKFCAVPAIGSFDWICRSLENYSKYLFNDFMFPYWKYFNSGFMIFNQSHKKLFSDIKQFYDKNRDLIVEVQTKLAVGTDQPVLNFFIQKDKIDIKYFPYEYNMQDLNRFEILGDDLLFTKWGYVYHFNAIPNNHDAKITNYFMKKTYDYLSQT